MVSNNNQKQRIQRIQTFANIECISYHFQLISCMYVIFENAFKVCQKGKMGEISNVIWTLIIFNYSILCTSGFATTHAVISVRHPITY